MDPNCVVAAGNVLGESASWSATKGTVRWIDGLEPALHEFSPTDGAHRVTELSLPLPIGMIVETADPGIIAVAHRNGVVLLNLDSGIQTQIASPEHERSGVRYNDAKVDLEGRLWQGTCDGEGVEPRGCLWVLENGRRPRLAETGMAVVNGPAFHRTAASSTSAIRLVAALSPSTSLGERSRTVARSQP